MMNEPINNQAMKRKSLKILLLFMLLVIAVVIFLISIVHTIRSNRDIPSAHATSYDRSLRGAIVSEDGYTLSSSQKTYQAMVRGESIKPEKRELFIKFFSIYSGIPAKEIQKKLFYKNGKAVKGHIILSKTINARAALQLKSLAHKLRSLGVFQWVKNASGVEYLYGLDVIENGEGRRFPLKDVMSPILGYVGEKQEGRYIHPEGKKGLEKYYEKYITSKKNGYFRGKRDVVGTIIHDNNSIKIRRVDGMDLHLNIPLALQRRVEIMLDAMKERIDAQEIIIGVMRSNTGEVLSLASSERFDPSHIRQKDIPALNPKFAEYPYEPGSVLKPLTLSIAIDHGRVTPQSAFDTENGRMKIDRFTITDDHKYPSLNATDIIVHSSNIGISKISWTLSGLEFRSGLLQFGVARQSGIDLSRDLPGTLKPLYKLNHQLHRANTAYGYGMHMTFAQLLKAYSVFNNDGVAVTPRIVNYLEDTKGNHYILKPKVSDLRAIKATTAQQVHNILLKVVAEGTGVKAQYPGLEIGGKTGTAHITRKGRYVREYHSSFYGFANDKKGNKYTIGVLVIKAKKGHSYFAAQSAVPTFRNIIEILVSQDYLIPDPEVAKNVAVNEVLYGNEEVEPALPTIMPENEMIQVSTKPKAPDTSATQNLQIKKKTVKRPKPAPQFIKDIRSHENAEDLF
jgi:cell division protein FtsI (penicillin-binding protein 3)